MDLVDVSNDAFVRQQAFYVGLGEGGDSLNVEVAECGFYGWPLFLNDSPVKACLEDDSAEVLKVCVVAFGAAFAVPPVGVLCLLQRSHG